MSDIRDEATDSATVTEEEIESNFRSYRPYVESCVKILDLIVYFRPFSEDQTKKFCKTSKSDPVGATRQAFDAIIEMKHLPNRFQTLLNALENAEYPKIVNLLKGQLIRVHDAHRKKLKNFAKDMFERLSVSEILPYLLSKQVLNPSDVEELRVAERNDSRGGAAMQLLSVLPNRNKDWFELFLSALIDSQQKDLAIIIDQDLTDSKPYFNSS